MGGVPTTTPDAARQAIRTYAALRPALQEATEGFLELLTSVLDDAGINYLSVTGRTKTVVSFAAKALREVDGEPEYADPLEEITDQIGLRVITYLGDDVRAAVDLLSDQFEVLDDRDLGQETAEKGHWGYASRHLVITPAGTPEPPHENLAGRRASVQVRTVLQHAWAEFEHDIRYKGTVPLEHSADLDRRFTLAAGLLELADREFSAIRDRLQETASDARPNADPGDPRIGTQELTTYLTGKYAEASWSRTDHYSWIAGLLLELGITSLDELDVLLDSVDGEDVHRRMGYNYPAGAVRRLDDALLAIFGEQYVALTGNAHRAAKLRGRLERLT
ncbi:GTP pyrophosphokinase [Nocardioides islandensis]|uniref:GTP pyrophosphokinase n=1 Tax=Nocardioides islandensis TaxID=433663 RepID=A0A930VJH4_9ACTN|nr:GTP pyrophosphokinase [Nocardioides islandensis]